MAFRHIETVVKPYTHALAVEVAGYQKLGIERDLVPRRQDVVRAAILSGRAVPFYIARVKVNGEAPKKKKNGQDAIYYRANGQHTSDLLAKWPENQENGGYPEGLIAVVSDFEADRKEDAAALFHQFDPHSSARTKLDLYGAYQGIYPNIADVPRESASLALDGALWYRKNIEGLPVNEKDAAAEHFGDLTLHSFIRWFGTFTLAKAAEMKEIPVAAAMFGTFETNQEEADVFWKDVAAEGGGNRMDETHPTTALDKFLVANTKKQRIKHRVLSKLRPASYYQACVFCWNANRQVKPVKNVNFDTTKGLFEIQ